MRQNAGACFTQQDVFPLIAQAIENLCEREGRAQHSKIVSELLANPDASAMVASPVAKCPHISEPGMAGNMVAWFSQRYLPEYAMRFERHKGPDRRYVYVRRRKTEPAQP